MATKRIITDETGQQIAEALEQIARNESQNKQEIGDLNELTTEDKRTLVKAINEAITKIEEVPEWAKQPEKPTYTKDDLGLNNVDNTSDENKPVSNATRTELDKKQTILVSGDNIKTINGQSILGGGNLQISDADDIKTINGQRPDANGNINVNVMTDADKANMDKALEVVDKADIVPLLFKRGVVSQKQTWWNEAGTQSPGDYHHYVMSNIQWGIIPQANIDLFLSAGAEFNDTDSPIEKTAPWGETVQHLPGYFYLNGLCDISYREMEAIYNIGVKYICGDYGKSSVVFDKFTSPLARTRIYRNATRESWWFYYSLNAYSTQTSTMEVFTFDINRGQERCYDLRNAFIKMYNLMYIAKELNVIECTDFLNAFHLCFALRYVRLKDLTESVSFSNSAWLSNDSIRYIIENSSASKAITITLHAKAYIRAMEDGEIVSALESKPLITLASA